MTVTVCQLGKTVNGMRIIYYISDGFFGHPGTPRSTFFFSFTTKKSSNIQIQFRESRKYSL